MHTTRELTRLYEDLYARYGPQKWWPARTPFEMALGAILTQNTAWNNVEKAIANLRHERLLTSRALAGARRGRVEACVRPAGYYRQKAERVQRFARLLVEEHDGRLERLVGQGLEVAREELLAFNGIGPETADSILLYAGKYPVFVVDAYTKRVLKQEGITREQDYHKLQTFMEENLPRDFKLYQEFHALLVRHAKELRRNRETPHFHKS